MGNSVKVSLSVFVLGALFSAAQTFAQPYPVPGTFNESPMLEDLVAAGELPPIAERIPTEPFVVGSGVLISEEWLDFEIGNFGGTINLAGLDGFTHEIALALGTSILRAPDQSTENPAPALVSSYEINDDYTKYTMTIREGLKWSDGAPVTTEDVRFRWELYNDERIYSSFPTVLRSQDRPDGTPGVLDIVDDLTFSITFDKPYGLFLAQLNSWILDYTMLFSPSHYLKQFHGDYTPVEEIQSLLDREELENWWDLVELKDISHWEMTTAYAVGVPTLTPWIAEEITSSSVQLVRNPYYWRVDTEGNQLPYIDRVKSDLSNELATINVKTIAGEVDLLTQLAQLPNLPLYRQNAEQAGIDTRLSGSINNPPILFLNHDFDYENPNSAWQQLVQDSRFGQALALAINHEDVNENLYFGLYTMPTVTPAEFDPEEGGRLLDELGMNETDDQGFRLGPDGTRFELNITFADIQFDFVPLSELLKSYFEDVKIRTRINVVGEELFYERGGANQLQATIHWSNEPLWSSGMSNDYLPDAKGTWAPETWNWYLSNGESGRKPPAYLQEFLDIHAARAEFPPESPEGKALFEDLMAWFGEHYMAIWPVGEIRAPTVYAIDLGNVVADGYPFGRAGDYAMDQLFFKSAQ